MWMTTQLPADDRTDVPPSDRLRRYHVFLGLILGRAEVPGPFTSYAWTVALVAGAGLAAAALEHAALLPNLSLVFLTAVLIVSVRFGTGPALAAAALSLGVYNFFFTEPHFTFSVYSKADALNLAAFVLVALLTGNLAGHVRTQLDIAEEAARRNANLYEFSRKIADTRGLANLLQAICGHIAATTGGRALVLLPTADGTDDIGIAAALPSHISLSPAELAAARAAWRGRTPLPVGDGDRRGPGIRFLPLRTGRETMGLIGVERRIDDKTWSAEQERLLAALADQSAVAIERTQLGDRLEAARVLAEAESLRTALLSSLSHDLRTPLVSVIGSAATLETLGDSISPDDRRELIDTILQEGRRLNRFVQNLLDMTRLEHGALQPRRDWTDLREVVGRAVFDMREQIAPDQFRIFIPDDLPLLFVDPVLLEQVVVNVLDNAIKYSPAGEYVEICATAGDGIVELRVTDKGPGIPEGGRARVFDMFYRIESGEARSSGTGLGLSICKGLMEAQGGWIRADAGMGGTGTCMVLGLPVIESPAMDDTTAENGDDRTGQV